LQLNEPLPYFTRLTPTWYTIQIMSMLLNTALAMALKEWTDAADIVISNSGVSMAIRTLNASHTGVVHRYLSAMFELDDDSSPAACIMAVKLLLQPYPIRVWVMVFINISVR